MSETIPQGKDWLEEFRAQYDLDRIPEENVRRQFGKFLSDRAANRALYLSFPLDRFHEGIGSGDSPQKELIHQIGHSRMRIKALEEGIIPYWEYSKVYPLEHQILKEMERDKLIEQFDESTATLYKLLTDETTIDREIQLPWNKKTTGAELLEDMMRHEAGHALANTKLQDHFGTPRPPEMKRVWG